MCIEWMLTCLQRTGSMLQVSALEKQLASLDAQLMRSQSSSDQLQRQLAASQSEVQALQEQIKADNSTMDQLRQQNAQLQAESRAGVRGNEHLKAELEQAQAKVGAMGMAADHCDWAPFACISLVSLHAHPSPGL